MDHRQLWTPATRGLDHRARVARLNLSRKPLLVLLHVPKTGGTAVREAMLGHEHEGAFALAYGRHRLTLADVEPGTAVVLTVRDPVTRFVSGFYDRQRKSRPRYNTDWNPAERLLHTRFATAGALAEALDSADPDERDAAHAGMGAHFLTAPLTRWLGTPTALRRRRGDLFAVLRQETLAADVDALADRLGLPLTLPDGVAAHRGPDGVQRELSDRARRNLDAWFADDHELLRVASQVAP